MTEIGTFMKAVERIEFKIDEIRGTLHEIDIMANGTQIKQAAQEKEIHALRSEVASLRTAYDRVSGAWKLLTLPGFESAAYVISQIFAK